MSKESMMNKAQDEEPKRVTGGRPAASRGGSEVGNETKADMSVQRGGSKAEAANSPIGSTKLGHAVKELHDQHPIHHSDHGPHHGTDHHRRHEPLHGMKSGGYGR